MQCSKCPRDAIVFQRYSGLHLCSQHSIADVEAKAKKMIRSQGWLRPGDHIAVLLSGDQNSSALLYFLKKLTAQRRDIRISAITITERTDSRHDISCEKRGEDSLGTGVIEMSWPEESLIRTGPDSGKNPNLSSPPMSLTSHFINLDGVAQKYGITKLAWALCLDDTAAVVLGNIIRGEGENLVRNHSHQDALPRICPFISVTAAELSLYASLCGCSDEPAIHPEQGDVLHKDLVTMLDSYTNNHPATKYALLNLGEILAGPGKGIDGLIRACKWYGESNRGYCNDNSPHEVTDGTR